jgi:hypothetical protein
MMSNASSAIAVAWSLLLLIEAEDQTRNKPTHVLKPEKDPVTTITRGYAVLNCWMNYSARAGCGGWEGGFSLLSWAERGLP